MEYVQADLVVQTISGNFADRLFKLLESSELAAPSRMKGKMNTTYNIGPSTFNVKLTTLQKVRASSTLSSRSFDLTIPEEMSLEMLFIQCIRFRPRQRN